MAARSREMGSGWAFCHFPCAFEDSDLLERLLTKRYSHCADAASFSSGALHFRIDLSQLPVGDGPAMRERIERDLHKTRSRHRMPSDPP